MKRMTLLSCLLVCSALATAGEGEGLSAMGLRTTDPSGCFTTDGRSVWPTISLMVAAYGDPKVKNDVVLKVVDRAIKSGCDISAPDAAGLSPLNAAILYNEPVLVGFLLERGADTSKRIASPKEHLNGLDSLEFVDLLMTKDKAKDRQAVKLLLEKHGGKAAPK